MKKIRVAIAGCGKITIVRHAPEYANNENVELKGFYDYVPEHAQELSNKYGGKVYLSFEDVLGDKEIDAVSICSANIYHAQMAIDALNAGKHVLCEKPMATNVEDAQKMVDAAEKSGKNLMIGHNQRLSGGHRKARELISKGELGKVLTFKTTFGHSGPETWGVVKGKGTWFFNKSISSMGTLADLGIHKVDLIRYLLGEEIKHVSSFVSTLDKTDEDGNPIEIEDNAVCILKMESGVIGTLSSSWTYYGDEDNCTVLYCSEGELKVYGDSNFTVIVTKKNKEKINYNIDNIQTNENQTNSGVIDLFISNIIEGKPSEISGYDGLMALKVIEACFESSKTGRTISL